MESSGDQQQAKFNQPQAQVFANQQAAFRHFSLHFSDPTQTEEFKIKVCLPYFKDIYKDLASRSDDKSKGVNKISMLDYCQLPGLIGERFFHVLDADKDSYLSQKEFLYGLLGFYCSTFDQKVQLVFDIYDFDGDGYINKKDITTIISCMPVIKRADIHSEGKFTQEGGGAQNFQERVNTLEEMFAVLDHCFGDKEKLAMADFQHITEHITSDMVLSVLSLFRERLPCSENYWRYKRNFELHKKLVDEQGNPQPGPEEENKEQPRQIAQSHLSFVRGLSPYNQGAHQFKPPSSPRNNAPQGNVQAVQHPAAMDVDEGEDAAMVCDEDSEIQIPIANFKTNHLKTKHFGPPPISAESLSPTALAGNIMGVRKEISAVKASGAHCICGLPCPP